MVSMLKTSSYDIMPPDQGKEEKCSLYEFCMNLTKKSLVSLVELLATDIQQKADELKNYEANFEMDRLLSLPQHTQSSTSIGLGKYPASKVKFNEKSSSEMCEKVDLRAEAEPLIKQNSKTSETSLQYLFKSDQDWDGNSDGSDESQRKILRNISTVKGGPPPPLNIG